MTRQSSCIHPGRQANRRGVMLSHGGINRLLRLCEHFEPAYDWGLRGDSFVNPLPNFISCISGSRCNVCTTAWPSPSCGNSTPQLVLKTIVQLRPTLMTLTPTMLQMLLDHPQAAGTDFSLAAAGALCRISHFARTHQARDCLHAVQIHAVLWVDRSWWGVVDPASRRTRSVRSCQATKLRSAAALGRIQNRQRAWRTGSGWGAGRTDDPSPLDHQGLLATAGDDCRGVEGPAGIGVATLPAGTRTGFTISSIAPRT